MSASSHVRRFVQSGIVLGASALTVVSAFSADTCSPEKTQAPETEAQMMTPASKGNGLFEIDESWRVFLGQRLDYHFTHRLDLRDYVDIYRESERQRVVVSDLEAKRARDAFRKSSWQTLREEFRIYSSVDNWVEQRIVEPVNEFVGDTLLRTAWKVVMYPLQSLFQTRKEKKMAGDGAIRLIDIGDMLTGREEKNQLANPLNKEGIPGEERYQPSRLPEKVALGARFFQSNPYGYGTLRMGDWYTHARLSAADLFDRPRLNETSLMLQTELSPHDFVFSFGGKMPFKDKKEPERYFGPHGFIGLSKIIANGRNARAELYLEGAAGENQSVFASVSIRY